MQIRPHCALKVVLFSAVAGIAMPLTQAAEPAKSGESGKTHTVSNVGVKMTVPGSWKSKDTHSNVHVMQFSIPKLDGDKDETEASVWYYGLTGMGSVNEIFQRWIDEFPAKDRKLKITTGKCPQGEYILMDVSGTWDRKVPTAEGGLKIVHTAGREIAVRVAAPHAGNYYYRLQGTEQNVAANVDAFRAAIGADAKNEKDYKAPTKVTAQKPVVEKPAAPTTKPAEAKPAAAPSKAQPGKVQPKK